MRRVVALVSGGKDSCFNMMQCVAAGHDIVALANLYPVGKGKENICLSSYCNFLHRAMFPLEANIFFIFMYNI